MRNGHTIPKLINIVDNDLNSKSGAPLRVPWVRIPPLPFKHVSLIYKNTKAKVFCLRFCYVKNYFKFSGFRHLSSSKTKIPSLRIKTSSKYISPPPYSFVCMQTKSQCNVLLLPLSASS